MSKDKYSWGDKAECKFVDGLGTWQEPRPQDITLTKAEQRLWLEKYIVSHAPSLHSWHKAGVIHALGKLKGLKQKSG